MSRSRDIARRAVRLTEIREIMDSMKALAYMQVRKLLRRVDRQREAVEEISTAAREVAAAYLGARRVPAQLYPVWIVIGSEQGFCGDFNDELMRAVAAARATTPAAPAVIGVGHKLNARLGGSEGVVAAIDGAIVAEDVDRVLARLTGVVDGLRDRHGAIALTSFHHRVAAAGPAAQAVLPAFPGGFETNHSPAPIVHLAPPALFAELVNHWLFATLHGILIDSLLAESERRVRHLDGAVRHLDERLAQLDRRRQQARQNEIIEEIEVILLAAGHEAGRAHAGARQP
ncbi:MAG: F0F1 ATP synthase subunit gamma [Gammaproteobacteria bacterium]